MKIVIRKMGNSQGVILPKPLLAQVGLAEEAEITVEEGALVLRPPRKHAREGWADAAQALAAAGDDGLVWPEFANADDKDLKW
jgi:antitoxin MazE